MKISIITISIIAISSLAAANQPQQPPPQAAQKANPAQPAKAAQPQQQKRLQLHTAKKNQKTDANRFDILPKELRQYAIAAYKFDKRLTLVWCDIIVAKQKTIKCDLTWGLKARPKAEKEKIQCSRNLPKLIEDFTKRHERDIHKLDGLIKRLNKEIDKIKALPPSKNETTTAKRTKEIETIVAKRRQYEELRELINSMESNITAPQTATIVRDRFMQIGLSDCENHAVLKKMLTKYNTIIHGAFHIKDIKADIKRLEELKKQAQSKPKDGKPAAKNNKTAWTSSNEKRLASLQALLKRDGEKLKKESLKYQMKLKKELEKQQKKIDQDRKKLEKMSESRRSKAEQKLWDMEALKLIDENCLQKLIEYADWKKL
jgi:hypothetical protein